MPIENIMYFALGMLVAGLVALVLLPAVWKRAVRLTKRRIEAATPVTMAEFRADKDQLRAEFALSTRKLEMTIDTLRKRLAEQLGDVNQKRTDLGALKVEREKHLSIVKDLETREADLRARVLELERENTDVTQRLRMREREVETLRQNESTAPAAIEILGSDGENLSTAEARMASAETSLNALLAETAPGEGKAGQPLADRLDLEAEIDELRAKVLGVESTIIADWNTDRMDDTAMRGRLADIADTVSRLVYAVEKEASPAGPESLFDRVQRFADGQEVGAMTDRRGQVTERMAAIQEIQRR